MAVNNDGADSGQPGADNASPAGKEVGGLDRAIAAAMGGMEESDDDLAFAQMAKAKGKTSKSEETEPIAGEARADEDAPLARRTSAKVADAEAVPQDNAPAIEAPQHWPEDRRKAFAGWPREVQNHALAVDKDLQAGFTKRSQELSDQAKFGQAVRGLIDNDTRGRIQSTGMDEVGYFRYLHSLQQAAMRDGPQYVAWAMRQLGVAPEQLGLTAAGQRQQQQVDPAQQQYEEQMLQDPAYKHLRDQIGHQARVMQSLQARLEAQDRAARDWENQQRVQATSALDGMWQTFRSQTDDTGQLAYPHADQLMAAMGALMETHGSLQKMPDGPDKLAKAYQMAVSADPELSKPIIEAQIAARLAEAEKKREVERAKRVAAVRPASGAPAVPTKGKTGIDGALEAAWDRLSHRS